MLGGSVAPPSSHFMSPKGMLHKLFSFTMALFHDWKMYGAKKENGDIETKLTHCSGPLLSYVLTHDEPTQTNTVCTHALDCLFLCAIQTKQGGYECYHIATCQVIT